MRFVWAAATHQGRLRSKNEDAVHPETGGAGDGPLVAVVADGMGGHAAGDVASRVAVEAAVESEGSPVERVQAANQAVVAHAQSHPSASGMGTTMTLAEVDSDGRLDIGHVGDSRAYLWRDGRLELLTTDHSLVAEYVAEGRITETQARSHPQRSVITRALGLWPDVIVDSVRKQLHSGDLVLLCTDGLSGMVGDPQIGELLADTDPEAAVWALIEAANRAGGEDNITVVVIATRT